MVVKVSLVVNGRFTPTIKKLKKKNLKAILILNLIGQDLEPYSPYVVMLWPKKRDYKLLCLEMRELYCNFKGQVR